MSLLKELHSLSVDSTRSRVIDMFVNNMKKADRSHLKKAENMRKLTQVLRDQDDEHIFRGMSDEALEQLVRLHLEPTLEAEETENSDDQDSENNEPRLLVKAGDFRVMLYPEEQIKILDNSEHVRLEMPLVIWKQLSRG